MAGKGTYQVKARVLEVFPNGTARAVFPNGHVLLAHGEKKSLVGLKDLLPDDEIMVEVTTYDLSKGRLVARCGRNM